MSRKPKVYFVACAFPPFGRGNAITNACVANGLSEFFRVQVICKELSGGLLLNYQEDASLLDDLPSDLTVSRVAGGRWLGIDEILYGIGLLPCYYLSWAWKVWRQRRRLVREPGVIMAVYPVFSDLLVGYLLSWAYGYPLLVDFRDDFSGVMSRGWRKILSGWYRRMEAGLVRQADGITVTTETLKADMIRRHGLAAEKVSVVYNIVPEAPKIAAAALAPPDGSAGEAVAPQPLVVTYAGAISRIQRPEILLRAYDRLGASKPGLADRLRVELYGPESPYYRRHVRPHLTAGATFGGFLPKRQIDAVQATADIGFLSLGDATYAYATPTKLFDYVALELPIVAALPDGAARDIIVERGLGLVVDIGDVDGLARCLERMMQDADLRCRCRQNLHAAGDEFAPERQIAEWRHQLDRLVSGGAVRVLGQGLSEEGPEIAMVDSR